MLSIHVVFRCSLPDVGSTSIELEFLKIYFFICSYVFHPWLLLDFIYIAIYCSFFDTLLAGFWCLVLACEDAFFKQKMKNSLYRVHQLIANNCFIMYSFKVMVVDMKLQFDDKTWCEVKCIGISNLSIFS